MGISYNCGVPFVTASHGEGTPVSICGEMAGDPGASMLLMAMGYDVLSMNSTNLPRVKSVLRATSLEQAEALLASVMKLTDAETVSRYVEIELKKIGIRDRPKALQSSV